MMRKVSLMFVIFVLIGVVTGSAISGEQTDLLPDPGFEEGGKEPYVKGEGRNRSGCIKIVSAGRARPWHSALMTVSGRCRVSAWLKTARIAAGAKPWHIAFVTMIGYDINRKEVKGAKYDLVRLQGSNDWQRFSKDVTLAPQVRFVKIICGISGTGTGTVWFDDLSLRALAAGDNGSAVGKDDAVRRAARQELARLGLGTHDRKTRAGTARVKVTRIELVSRTAALDMHNSQVPGEKFPLVPEIKIKDGNFMRNNRPAYLLGAEDLFPNPWTCNLLGLEFGGFYIWSSDARVRGETLVYYSATPSWTATRFRERLVHGILPYYQVMVAKRVGVMEQYFPELCLPPGHHYLVLAPETVMGRKIRRQFYQDAFRLVKGLPCLGVEVFNEVYYQSPSPENLVAFRLAMEKKYRTIERANQAWGTAFPSFAAVKVPWKSIRSISQYPAGFAAEFLWEWFAFNEKCFGRAAVATSRLLRSIAGNVRTSIQATSGLATVYGGNGVNPREKVRAESFYGAEFGDYFFVGKLDDSKMRHMFKPMIVRDYLRHVSPDKPIVDEENHYDTVGVTKEDIVAGSVVPLMGTWRFRSEREYKPPKGAGGMIRLPAAGKSVPKWQEPGLDDSSWARIKVPGMWGPQGHAYCTVGWYRRHFRLGPKQDAGCKLYLHGGSFADRARVYLNGRLVMDTAASGLKWSARWLVPVSGLLKPAGQDNVLAVRAENNYFDGAVYCGGIRGYVALSPIDVLDKPLFTSDLLRTVLWSDVVHGISGRVTTYFYADAEGHTSALFGFNKTRGSLLALPKFKVEVATVADIVLPRPRIRGRVAMLYSLPTFRAMLPASYGDQVYGRPVRDIAGYYGALLTSGVPLDVIDDVTVAAGRLSQYRMLVMPLCRRVATGVPKAVEDFVRAGGVLVLDSRSMAYDDTWHRPLSVPKWWGISIGDALRVPGMVKCAAVGIMSRSMARETDGICGMRVALAGATALASYDNGGPAITCNRYGKGAVYYLAANLPISGLKRFFAATYRRHDIRPDFVTSPAAATTMVEAQMFRKNGRLVWYFLNWAGEAVQMSVRPGAPLPDGQYRLRNIATGEYLPGSGQASQWQADELNRTGIRISLPSRSPLVILVEPANRKPTVLAGLTPMQKKWLPRVFRPSPKQARRILFLHRPYIRKPVLQAAVHLLEQYGYEVNCAKGIPRRDGVVTTYSGWPAKLRNEKLADYQVVFLPGPAFGKGDKKKLQQESDAVQRFVFNGGAFFACSYVHRDLRPQNRRRLNALLAPYKIRVDWSTGAGISVSKDYWFNEKRYPTLRPASSHPVFAGVEVFQSFGIGRLIPAKEAAVEILLRAPAAAGRDANQPLMAAAAFGKGRVLAMGDASWIMGYNLQQADNARLLLNIFDWLVTGRIAKRDPGKLEAILANE